MPEYIYDISQMSDEWFAKKVGRIGGSSINSVLAKGQGKMRKGLMYKLAAETLTGKKTETYQSDDMRRGIFYEPEARLYYELINGVNVVECALIISDNNDRVLVSPDGIIGDTGGLEIKTMLPHVWVEQVSTGAIATAYKRQCQHFLWVSEREWIDFIAYCPEMPSPMWTERITRDEKLIREMRTEVGKFLVELDELIERLKH